MSSLPVTVIVAKLPVSNLTELISLVESSRNLATAIRSGNAMDDIANQLGSNPILGSDDFDIVDVKKRTDWHR